MDKTVFDLLNNQIQKELESAYIYLQVASYFDEAGLDGFGSWFKKQSGEEVSHAMKIYDFLHDRNQVVVFMPIGALDSDFENHEQALSFALEHEKYITGLIWKIYETCENCGDLCTKNFLEWFINEQREEEAHSREMLDKYRLFGMSCEGLFQLDKCFGNRK